MNQPKLLNFYGSILQHNLDVEGLAFSALKAAIAYEL